jgi:uracil-DNA glycosylase family 4
MPISAKESIKKLSSEILSCQRCKDLAKLRKTSVPGTGAPKANIIIVSDFPHKDGAEKKGVPFTGDDSGKFMMDILKEVKLSLTKDTYITYLVKCTPRKEVKVKDGKKVKEGKKPAARHVSNCISYLTQEISISTPHILVSLGLDVSNTLLQNFFSIDKKFRKIEKIHMRVFENPSFKLVPFFSPHDVVVEKVISKEKYIEDFNSLARVLKIV